MFFVVGSIDFFSSILIMYNISLRFFKNMHRYARFSLQVAELAAAGHMAHYHVDLHGDEVSPMADSRLQEPRHVQ